MSPLAKFFVQNMLKYNPPDLSSGKVETGDILRGEFPSPTSADLQMLKRMGITLGSGTNRLAALKELLKEHSIPFKTEGGKIYGLDRFMNPAGKYMEEWRDLSSHTVEDLKAWLGY